MKTYAVVQANIVVNMVAWDGQTEWTPPPEMTAQDVTGQNVGIGSTWNGTAFSAPPDPTQVTS